MDFIELVLHVAYDWKRANEYLTMDSRHIGHMVRLDFDGLKLPHPLQENIRRPKSNGITVSWITRVGTPLYEQVTRIVDRQDEYATRTAKYKCRIETLSLKELTSPIPRKRRESAPPRRRRPASSRPPIVTRTDSVERIDGVMQSLRKISDSFTQGEARANEVSETSDQPPTIQQAASTEMSHRIRAKPIRVNRREDIISRLTDELRLIRKQVAENMDKAARLEKQIDALRSPGEIDESLQDLDQLTIASLELSRERKKREEVEQILADVRRECSHPTMVPEILNMIGSLDLSDATVGGGRR